MGGSLSVTQRDGFSKLKRGRIYELTKEGKEVAKYLKETKIDKTEIN